MFRVLHTLNAEYSAERLNNRGHSSHPNPDDSATSLVTELLVRIKSAPLNVCRLIHPSSDNIHMTASVAFGFGCVSDLDSQVIDYETNYDFIAEFRRGTILWATPGSLPACSCIRVVTENETCLKISLHL